jgi:hypothetical protein
MRHEPSSGFEDASFNYLVAWIKFGGNGHLDEKIFTGRDQGWDFYKMLEKSARYHKVTWYHILAQ